MAKTSWQILTYLIFILTSCNCQEKKNIYNPKAIELNNIAVKFIETQKFDSALIYLDKAIKIDSTDYLFYSNKSTVYCSLKDYRKALGETENSIKVKPDLAEAWAFAGLLNDKLGDTINAFKCYKKSIEIYDERISNPDKQKYLKENKANRAISYILIGQDDIGRNELKKLIAIYPSDNFLQNFLKMGKKEYLDQLFNDE